MFRTSKLRTTHNIRFQRIIIYDHAAETLRNLLKEEELLKF